MFWRVPRRSPPVLEINRGNLFGAHIDAYWVPGVPYTSIGTPLDDYNKLGRVGTAANTSTTNRYIAGSQKAIGGGDFSFLFVGEIPADDSPLCYFVDPTAANFPSGYLWWGESSIFTQEWVFGGHWGGGFQDIRFTFTGRPTGICAVAASFINGVGGYLSVNGRSGFSANVISRGTASGHVFTLGSDSGSIDGATKWNLAASFNRAWPPEILNTLTKDLASPWQIFAPTRRAIAVSAPAADNTGSLTATLGAVTASSTATIAIAGTSTPTLGAVTSSATGTIALSGSATPTLGAVTSSATGALALAGTLTATLGAVTLSSAGSSSELTGTLSVTLDAATLSSAGVIALAGSATPTLAALTSSSTGVVALAGSLTATLADVTLLSDGTISGAVIGDLAVTLGSLRLTAEGIDPNRRNSGAGTTRKKKRRRQFVEIDGQDFEVSSPEEAIALLERAKTIAVQAIEKAHATRIKPGLPRIRTSPELRAAVHEVRAQITDLYDGALRDYEIAALMAQADEEEEAIIRLLM